MLWWLWGSLVVHATPNFGEAIAQSMQLPVAMTPDFGEGEGAFHPNSRYDVASVNCMTWFQKVVASAYSGGEVGTEYQRTLDALRYYNQRIGFDSRKHFVARWLAYEPAPLVPISISACQTNQVVSTRLQLQAFRAQHSYTCPLYQETGEKEQLLIPYLDAGRMAACQQDLPDGYYALFMVPNAQWTERWSTVGDLGIVHAMILYHADGVSTVYQASIDQQAVVAESWEALEQRLRPVAKGYRVFGFDPTWKPDTESTFSTTACR